MTAHAKCITRQNGLVGMRIMTIQAVDPRMVHPAAQKGCEDIVFFPDLPIRVVDIRGIGNHQRVMIQKGSPGAKSPVSSVRLE